MIGEERLITDLIQPSSVILHKDLEGYALMNPLNSRYDQTLTTLRQYQFEHAISADPVTTSAEGIELRFPDELPLQSLLAYFDGNYDQMNTSREVNRLLIYVTEEDTVNFTFASSEKEEFMSLRTTMPASDLKKLNLCNRYRV